MYKYLTTNVRNVCNNIYTYTHIIYIHINNNSAVEAEKRRGNSR